MTHPRRNIELKARCVDLDAARAAAEAAGATFVATLAQTDTYFVVARGRLKLREMPDRAELIAYDRSDTAEVRGCDYHVVPVADGPGLLAALASTAGIRGQVFKRRDLWMWQNVRIHLDRVEGLGTFVEFEAVLGEGETDQSGHAKVKHLCAAMGITDADRLAVAYADLLGL